MKVYAIQCKNGIMRNVDECKELDEWGFSKNDYSAVLVCVTVNVIRHEVLTSF